MWTTATECGIGRKMKINLFIVRHGIRQDNDDKTWVHTAKLPKDPPLSKRGFKQAAEVAKFLNSSQAVNYIYASPYLRTLQTGSTISKHLALPAPVRIEHGLREWVHTKFEGPLFISRKEASSIDKIDEDFYSEYLCDVSTEDPTQLAQRCADFIQYFLKHIYEVAVRSGNETTTVVLVSHAATVIGMIRALLKNHQLPLSIGTCSLTQFTIDYSDTDPSWKMEMLGNCNHLDDGEQCAWGFPEEQTTLSFDKK